jgi:hypothetical protein
MSTSSTKAPATASQIVSTVAAEFAQGRHRRDAKELPFELQFRLNCSWGRALSYANDIRTGRVK